MKDIKRLANNFRNAIDIARELGEFERDLSFCNFPRGCCGDNPDFLNYDKSVYVGAEDDFHRLFEVEDRNVRENIGLDALGSFCQPRLYGLYKKIIKYI